MFLWTEIKIKEITNSVYLRHFLDFMPLKYMFWSERNFGTKWHGQGYDDRATVSGTVGVQPQFLQLEENACYAIHNIHLVPQEAVADITEVSNFMGVLQNKTLFRRQWKAYEDPVYLPANLLLPWGNWVQHGGHLAKGHFRYPDVQLSKISLVAKK